jgi:hypothetical protein
MWGGGNPAKIPPQSNLASKPVITQVVKISGPIGQVKSRNSAAARTCSLKDIEAEDLYSEFSFLSLSNPHNSLNTSRQHC